MRPALYVLPTPHSEGPPLPSSPASHPWVRRVEPRAGAGGTRPPGGIFFGLGFGFLMGLGPRA